MNHFLSITSAPRFARRVPLCIGLVVFIMSLFGCSSSKEKALKELARRGLSADAAALATAVEHKDVALLDYFEAAEVKAALTEEGTASLLQVAATGKEWPMVQRLLVFCDPPLVNHRGPGGRVILEEAVLAHQFALSHRLLAAGALPDRAACGADALVIQSRKEPALMDSLLSALPEGHAALGTALLREVAAGGAERAQRLLDRKALSAATPGPGKESALDLACAGGFNEIANQLIKAGAKPVESPAALRHAVIRKDLPLSRILLAAGAKVDHPTSQETPDQTPLNAALESGEIPMVRLLLEHGADRGLCQDHAFKAGDPALLDLLLEQGLAFDRPGEDGNPPLVRAAIEGHVPLIQKLLAKGAKLDQTGAEGQPAFQMAVIHRKPEAMDALLAAGALPDAPFLKPAPAALLPLFDSDYFIKWFKRDHGLTPLMLSAARGDDAVVRQLLKAGAKRGTESKGWHRYPINFACDTDHTSTAQILLGRNPDEEKDKRFAVISLSKQRITLFKNDKAVRSSRVSTGKRSTPTPTGKYVITDKQTYWVSSIYNVAMPFFMRLDGKDFGMHAGNLPGYPASHGCIRMSKSEVMAFFKVLKIGDPVNIVP